jgi:hypothetical protein
VAAEEVSADLEKCTRLLAVNASKNVKFLSSLAEIDLFTVKPVSISVRTTLAQTDMKELKDQDQTHLEQRSLRWKRKKTMQKKSKIFL